MRGAWARGAVLLLVVAAACMAIESTEVEEDLVGAVAQMGASAKIGANELDVAPAKKAHVADQPVAYSRVPHQKFLYKANAIEGVSQEKCKNKCDEAKKKCKSYSYNEATQSCLWSPEGFGYDPGWTYYSKEKTGEYEPIPGLVYKSQKERVVITSDKKLCQTKCDEDQQCIAFAYSVTVKKCGLLHDGAVWDKAWAVYLKPVDPNMNLSMDAVRQERLPALKKAAQKIIQARHDVKQREIDQKHAAKTAEQKGKENAKKIGERAVKEPKAKIALRESNQKKATKKAENDMKVSKETETKQATKLKEIKQKGEDKTAALAAAKAARDKAEADAEATKQAYEKRTENKQKADEQLKAAKATAASSEKLEKLKMASEEQKRREQETAKKLDAKVQAAAKMAEKKDKAESQNKQVKEKKDKADRIAAENNQKMEKVAAEQRLAKLQKAVEAKRNKEIADKAKKNAERDSKKAKEHAKKVGEKASKDVLERHEKSEANAEKKEKDRRQAAEKKKKGDRKQAKAEAKMKKDLKDKEKEDKESGQKRAERVAAGKHGKEALIKVDVKHLAMKANKEAQRGVELKQKIDASGSTDAVLIEREGTQKEKASKLEAQAMDARTKAGHEHRRKIEDKKKQAHREHEEKALEKDRKQKYHKKRREKKTKRVAELEKKNSAAHEEAAKKLNAEKLKMEAKAKEVNKKHVKKIEWLKIKGKEHDSKGEWKMAQITEAKLKTTTKSEAAAKLKAIADAKKHKEVSAKAKDEVRLAKIAEAAEKAKAAEAAKKETTAKSNEANNKKQRAAEQKKKKDKEISDKKEKAQKITNKEARDKAMAEVKEKGKEAASKAKIAAEKAAAARAAAQQAIEDAKRKKAQMEALAAEKVIKAAHQKKTEKHKKTEAAAKEITSKEERADKVHEKEQDVKERRTKKAPFNMTYVKNWETSISSGYSGAYSYVWKDFCVLGGVLSSVGTIPKERLYKKHVMFGALQTKGIRARVWGKLPAVTSMSAAMDAAKLNKGNLTTKVWYDKLDFPPSDTNPPKPWNYLDKNYVENFAANFTGFLKVSRGGLYKFWLTSTGGSELWLANREIIVNDQKNQLHGMLTKGGVTTLEPGPIPFVVKYFTRDPAAGLKLEWEGPDHKRTVLTSEFVGSKEKRALSDRFKGLDKPGWQATFWANTGMTNNIAMAMQNAVTPADTTEFNPNYRHFTINEIDYNDEKAPFWPGLSSRFEYRFAAKFTANLMISESGEYTFFLTSIDGSKLFIDGKLLVNNDGLHAKKTAEATIKLVPGSPEIEVRYFDNHHGSLLKAEYMGPQTGYKRVLISGGGKTPAVGQFKKPAEGRRLLSSSTELLELGDYTPKKDLTPKNRRRAKWLRDYQWGQEAEGGRCECEQDKDQSILSSLQFHRRRRVSSRRRFQGKGDPKDEIDEGREVDENDVFLDMGLGKGSEASRPPAAQAGKPKTPKKKFKGEQPPDGMNCKCMLPARQGGWKVDFWKNMKGLTTLSKAVMKVFTKKPDKTANLWSLAFQPIGGAWTLRKGDKPMKGYEKDYVAVFEGFVKIPKTGDYSFFVSSDDGAELYVDNTRVIDNDGLHDMQENAGAIKLVKDAQARIRLYYFSAQGSPGLILQWQGPDDKKKKVLDGNVVWSRKNPPIGNPASDAPVKIRRRWVARRRVELTRKELESCGIRSPPAKTTAAQARNEESMTKAAEKLSAVKEQVKAQTAQLHEAERRAKNHPVASARVKYAEIAIAMKKKVRKLQQDAVKMAQELQAMMSANPKAAKAEGVVAAVKDVAAAKKPKKTHSICNDKKTKLACCKTNNCSEAVVADYLKVKKTIAIAQSKATAAEKKAQSSTNPNNVKSFMLEVQKQQKKISKLGKKLSEALQKLNDPSNLFKSVANVFDNGGKIQGNDKAQVDVSSESQDGAEAPDADGGDNTLGEAKDDVEIMSSAEASAIRQQANEMTVKEKCANIRLKKSHESDLAARAKAKEVKDKVTAMQSARATMTTQCDKTIKNHNSIEKNPTASQDAKDESQMRVNKCQKKVKRIHEKLKKLEMRDSLNRKAAKSKVAATDMIKVTQRAILLEEMKAKVAAKKAEAFMKIDSKKQEKKKKTVEAAAKKSNYEVVAHLPKLCRPTQTSRHLAESADGAKVRVDIKPDGAVYTTMAKLRYLSLDGIMFKRNPNPEVKVSVKMKAPAKKQAAAEKVEETDLAESNGELQPEPEPQGAGHFDDFRVVHVFDVNKKPQPQRHRELGETGGRRRKKAKKEEEKENAPLAWDEKKTKAEFEKIQRSYNDPDVWTMCAREGNVCRARDQYKMKYGNQGVFRYRVSSGNTPCQDSVFGNFGPKETKKICYKYTPNAKRRRATGMFRDISKTGIKAQWWANVGNMHSVGDAMTKIKGKDPVKTFFVKNIMYPETKSFWNKLDSRFNRYFVAKFSGRMMIKETGKYQFYVTADDGAALYIDKEEVDCTGQCQGVLALQNSGPKTRDCSLQSEKERESCIAEKTVTGQATILKGTPRFDLEYFVNNGPHWLKVEWSGKDFSRRPLTDEFIGQYEKAVEEGGNWEKSAPEGGKITLKATTEVKFGVGERWVYKTFKKGVVMCSTAVFGDPSAGKPKNCYKRMDVVGDHWRECAADGQICKGPSGEHRVRFGANGRYAYLESMGNTLCSVETFGNPMPGDTSKRICSVLEKPKKPEPPPSLSGKSQKIDIPAGATRPYNLALKQKATQMTTADFGSVAFDGAPSRAVDGIISGKYGDNSCTHTFSGMNPWWRVELKKESTIFSVKIYGRTDGVKNCDHESGDKGLCDLNEANVYVSNNPYPGSGKACLKRDSNLDPRGTTINCHALSGRYVFVQKTGKASLSLCEVQVMGQPVSMKTVPKPPRRLPPPRNPMYAIKLKNGWTPVDAMKDKIRVHVAKLCDNCPDFLCVLQGNIQQMGGATPDSTSIIGTLPQMCRPPKQQKFLQANAVTGSAYVWVMPDGTVKASKFLNAVPWENVRVSLDGIYYITDGGKTAKKLAKKLAEAKDAGKKKLPMPKGYPGFTSKRMGPLCLVWGQVGGIAGSVVGTVSAECRPSQKLIFHAAASNAEAWISIDTAGSVVLETAGPVPPKYSSSAQLDAMMNGDGALVWINPMPAGGNWSALHNKTGRYPMLKKADPPLTKKMSDEAGKPTGVAKPETPKQLLKKVIDEKKAQNSAANSTRSVIRSDFELLEVEEENGVGKRISVSLSGIVYAVADHHPYLRAKRKTIYHGEKLKEINAKKKAKPPPKLSSCALPKIKDTGLVTEMKATKAKVLNQINIAKKAKDSIHDAFNEAAKAHYKSVIQKADTRAAELKKILVMLRTNQTDLHSKFGPCFKPKPKVNPLEYVTKMCTQWNGTRAEAPPDCCKQNGKCTMAQLESVNKVLDTRLHKYRSKQSVFKKHMDEAVGRAKDSAEVKRAANEKDERLQNMRDTKEGEAKKKMLQTALSAMRGEPVEVKVEKKGGASLAGLADTVVLARVDETEDLGW